MTTADQLREMEGHAAYWKNLYLDLLEKQPIPPEYQKEKPAAQAGDEVSPALPFRHWKQRAERAEAHLAAARGMLRAECIEIGDNDWPDELHLADVIEKHLARPVRRQMEKAESELAALREKLSEMIVVHGQALACSPAVREAYEEAIRAGGGEELPEEWWDDLAIECGFSPGTGISRSDLVGLVSQTIAEATARGETTPAEREGGK